MRVRPLALAAALVVSAGCDSSEPTFDVPPLPDLVPLAVGNEWVMEGVRTYPGRPGIPPREVDLGADTLRVVGDTLIHSERWFDVRLASRPDGTCHGGLYTHRDGSMYKLIEPTAAVLHTPALLLSGQPVPIRFPNAEAVRTLLPEPGRIELANRSLSTLRVELDVERFVGPPGYDGVEEVDGSVFEVDEYVLGVGFAVSECSYAYLSEGTNTFTLYMKERYMLTDYTLAGTE